MPQNPSFSAKSFFINQHSAFKVFLAFMDSSIFADNAAMVAAKIVDGNPPFPKSFDPYIPLSTEPGVHLRRLQSLGRPMMEMILIRLSDNFTTYLLDVVGECIRVKPELLKSSKDQISTELVFSVSSMDDLRDMLVERKLISVAYLSLEKQLEWISDRLGIRKLKDLECFPNLIELVESRNCAVHNRGKAGEKYTRALASYEGCAKLGELIRLSVESLFVAAKAAEEFVTYLDARLVEKYSIQTTCGTRDFPSNRLDE